MTNPDRDALVRDLLSASSGSRELSDRVLLAMGAMRKDNGSPGRRHDSWWELNGSRLWNTDPTQDLQDCADVCPRVGYIVTRHDGREASASRTVESRHHTAIGQHAEARARCAAAVEGKV